MSRRFFPLRAAAMASLLSASLGAFAGSGGGVSAAPAAGLSMTPIAQEAAPNLELGFWARSELSASLSPANPYDERFGRSSEALAQALREKAVSLGRHGALPSGNWKAAGLSDPETLAVAGADEADLKALAIESQMLPPSKMPPLAVAAGLSVAGLALLSVAPPKALLFLNENPWDKVVHFVAGAAIGFCSSEGGGVSGAALGLGAGAVVGVGKEMIDLHFDPRDALATFAGSAAGVAARALSGSEASCDPASWGLGGEALARFKAPSPSTSEVAEGWARGRLPSEFVHHDALSGSN